MSALCVPVMFVVLSRYVTVALPIPFTLSLSKGRSWFDKLTTNGSFVGMT